MSELKPGDRAVVIRPTLCCGSRRTVGMVIVITATPMGWASQCGACGATDHTGNKVPYDHPELGRSVIDRSRLLRLPPDDEAKRLFRETEKGVPA